MQKERSNMPGAAPIQKERDAYQAVRNAIYALREARPTQVVMREKSLDYIFNFYKSCLSAPSVKALSQEVESTRFDKRKTLREHLEEKPSFLSQQLANQDWQVGSAYTAVKKAIQTLNQASNSGQQIGSLLDALNKVYAQQSHRLGPLS